MLVAAGYVSVEISARPVEVRTTCSRLARRLANARFLDLIVDIADSNVFNEGAAADATLNIDSNFKHAGDPAGLDDYIADTG